MTTPGSKADGGLRTHLPDPPAPTPPTAPAEPLSLAASTDSAGTQPQELHIAAHPPLTLAEIAEAEQVLAERGWQPYAWNKPSAPARFDSADGTRTLRIAPENVAFTVERGDEAALTSVFDALLAANDGTEERGHLACVLAFTERVQIALKLCADGTMLDDSLYPGSGGAWCVAVATGRDYTVPQAIVASVSRAAFMAGLTTFADGLAGETVFTLAPPIARCPPGFTVKRHNPATGWTMFGLDAISLDLPRQFLKGYTLVHVASRVENWQRFDALGNLFVVVKREYQRPRHGLSKG